MSCTQLQFPLEMFCNSINVKSRNVLEFQLIVVLRFYPVIVKPFQKNPFIPFTALKFYPRVWGPGYEHFRNFKKKLQNKRTKINKLATNKTTIGLGATKFACLVTIYFIFPRSYRLIFFFGVFDQSIWDFFINLLKPNGPCNHLK